ncbi:tripartite tricarboxylate transporter TctB family protein [Sutcliffiella cohnii]|uniref:tripartite tricarboxylate transporter TctB family protein n=1 Tax=Sutcliffiella cohnii TaxID=33932 RepID=UPI002E24692A|nr:tripartite tricarboxylate transporter TctB family protein [Sutcliffiella cohnii]
MSLKRSELLISLVLVIISITGLIYSLSLPQGVNNNGVLRSGVFPVVVTSVLTFCSIIYFVQSIRELLNSEDESLKTVHQLFLGLYKNKVFLMMLTIFGYFILATVIGFILSTIILFSITLFFIFKHKLIVSLSVALLFSFTSHYVFQTILGVKLPSGFFM